MAERYKTRIAWEDNYINKVNQLADLTAIQIQDLQNAALLANNTGTIPGENPGVATSLGVISNIDMPEITNYNFDLPSNIKPAYITSGRIQIATGIRRSDYHSARIRSAKQTKCAGFKPVSKDMFTFVNPAQNNFAPDFAAILPLMYQAIAPKIKASKLTINSGYRSQPIESQNSAHMCGCAVDIGLTGENRYIAADACWELGLRGVAVGNTFIHVDCGPDPVVGWNYSGLPTYRGPSSH
jgi:hypothetical protein